MDGVGGQARLPFHYLFLTQAPARVGAFSLRQKLCGKRAAAT
jgi:hypothetical protein